MKTKLFAALGTGALILTASQTAMAHVSVGLSIGVPAPVYVAPAPVYFAPPPVRVVAYQPAPVMMPAVYVGWHGDRYWDGRRWWGHREWYGQRRW
ncbi:PXPV repeat protein [Paraburkholderia dinghuensis]|uniref:Uncharacterized protein n=1 Tax=Paraburkholderia dinghuensis TaxID=2305225 RepID=A0A3N6NVV0_9BURK|nr:PXPV repeat protein [Paraburkholderia dinghuensis]RQH04713.1 hypothetical protein D1Y85_17650 [Paraburkholderia dinghuensis]